MDEAKALKIQQELEEYCTKNGLWCVVQHEKKPDLKLVVVEISIKIDNIGRAGVGVGRAIE